MVDVIINYIVFIIDNREIRKGMLFWYSRKMLLLLRRMFNRMTRITIILTVFTLTNYSTLNSSLITFTILFNTITSLAITTLSMYFIFLISLDYFGIKSIRISHHQLQHITKPIFFIISYILTTLAITVFATNLTIFKAVAVIF